jgi:hypothetical protein
VKTLLLACALALTLGCATAPKPRTIENAFHFDNSYDEIWTAVMESMADLNLPIQTLEKVSGLIATDWIGFGYDKEVCDCGGSGIAIDHERRGKFNIFVKQGAAGGVEVKINTVFQVQRELMHEFSTVNCYSTGSLEAQLKTLISQKLTPA